jgi:hypothetical protein
VVEVAVAVAVPIRAAVVAAVEDGAVPPAEVPRYSSSPTGCLAFTLPGVPRTPS